MIKTIGVSLARLGEETGDIELDQEGGPVEVRQLYPSGVEGGPASYGPYLTRLLSRCAEIRDKEYELNIAVDVTAVGPVLLERFMDEFGEYANVKGYNIDRSLFTLAQDPDHPIIHIPPRDLAARIRLAIEEDELQFRTQPNAPQSQLKARAAKVLSADNLFNQKWRGGEDGPLVTALAVAYWLHHEATQA